MVFTRFAPSPTGLLHVGNVRTALINWLYTKAHNGTFLLRFDDTDKERSKQEYVDAIQRDLKWLGIEWDLIEYQSKRLDRYDEVIEQLKKDNRLYPCFETAEELEFKRKIQLGKGVPPIYDRAALKLTDEKIEQLMNEGKNPHWRFKLEHSTITWNDKVRGTISFEGKNLSDPILIRECGNPTYMLPSAVDDSDMNITHIVRGEDHISNTAIQIQLLEAIGATIPEFAHVSLIKTQDDKISKRTGGFDIASLREQHIQPLAILSMFAKLGSSDPVELFDDVNDLIKSFDIHKYSKSQANYDFEELNRLNIKLLQSSAFEEVQSLFNQMDADYIDEQFWLSVRCNINSLAEVKDWWEICKETITPIIEDSDFSKQAAELLPEGNWDENTWSEWISKVKQHTDRKGKSLFMPIRKALTARESGPELKQVLPLIGREKAYKRLEGEAA
ncbi:MAG: glutamate--tRNA ligase [Rickettsiales bacterium]|nr:glutamate--tRNA ligase [Rickettsiales bacterium]